MPEEPDKEGLRRWGVVAALGVTQVVSWGSLYYAFAVVMEAVRRDLAISSPVAVGAYCVALLVSGIVAAPVHANGGTFPWLTGGNTDFELMDQIVASAEA